MQIEVFEERRRVAPLVLLTILLPSLLVEAVLLAGDYGLIASPQLRFQAYGLLSLSTGYFMGTPEVFPFQRFAVFVTHVFLSGGIFHFVINMYALWSFGTSVIQRAGGWTFAFVFWAAILGGGIVSGILDPQDSKIGPSAGLFGLAAAIIYWNTIGLTSRLAPLLPTLWMVGLLCLILFAYWWRFGDILWFSNAGGLGFGALAAAISTRWIERE